MSRILIASEYNAKDRAHFAQAAEFCSVVASCDDADLIAPGLDNVIERRFGRWLPEHDSHAQRDFNRVANGVRKMLGLKNAPVMTSTTVTQDYDMFFFVAWSPQSLVELTRIKDWRRRCKIAVAYIFELWTTTLEQDRAYLKLLDQFDYVFMLHRKCVPALPAYTKARCSFLPVAVDCLLAAPESLLSERVIDVYSIGNRSTAVHGKLLEQITTDTFFYVYDSLASSDSLVRDWAEHRLLLTHMIKRSRYFIGFSPSSIGGPKAAKIANEEVLPGRLFEGAAGGAIILGCAPSCPEFAQYFSWPDAVIEIAPDGSDVLQTISELDQDPERSLAIRYSNVKGCLLNHDWAHRWRHILAAVGLAPLPQLAARLDRLNAAAAALQVPRIAAAAE